MTRHFYKKETRTFILGFYIAIAERVKAQFEEQAGDRSGTLVLYSNRLDQYVKNNFDIGEAPDLKLPGSITAFHHGMAAGEDTHHMQERVT